MERVLRGDGGRERTAGEGERALSGESGDATEGKGGNGTYWSTVASNLLSLLTVF